MISDLPTEASQEPVAACDTAFSCLLQLRTQSGANLELTAISRRNVVDGDTLTMSRLMELAGELGVAAEHAQLDWQSLRTAGSSHPVLILLKDTNVVLLTGGGRGAADEVAIWDPLQRHGKILFVSREDFEDAWTGHALIITTQPSNEAGAPPALGFCWLTSAGLEILGKTSARGQSHEAPIAPGRRGEFPLALAGAEKERLPPDLLRDAQPASASPIRRSAAQRLSQIARVCLAAIGITAVASMVIFLLRGPAADKVVAASTPAREVRASSPQSIASTAEAAVRPSAAPSGDGDAQARARPTIISPLEPLDRVTAPTVASLPAAPLPVTAPIVAKPAVAPPPDHGPSAETMPSGSAPEAPLSIATPAPAEPPETPSPAIASATAAPAPNTAPTAAIPASPAPVVGPRLSAAESAALLTRGDGLLRIGDVASARLFYERAANAGEGVAAVRLGETFDPIFIERAHLRGVRGDLGMAASWYRRARDLGAADAEVLLKALEAK